MGSVVGSIFGSWVYPIIISGGVRRSLPSSPLDAFSNPSPTSPSDPSSTPHELIAAILHPNPCYNPAAALANNVAAKHKYLPASTVTIRLQATEGVMYPSEEEIREFLKEGVVPGEEEIRVFLGGQATEVVSVEEAVVTGVV